MSVPKLSREDASYRDAWLAEMWAPVPEYREHPKPKPASKTAKAMLRERAA